MPYTARTASAGYLGNMPTADQVVRPTAGVPSIALNLMNKGLDRYLFDQNMQQYLDHTMAMEASQRAGQAAMDASAERQEKIKNGYHYLDLGVPMTGIDGVDDAAMRAGAIVQRNRENAAGFADTAKGYRDAREAELGFDPQAAAALFAPYFPAGSPVDVNVAQPQIIETFNAETNRQNADAAITNADANKVRSEAAAGYDIARTNNPERYKGMGGSGDQMQDTITYGPDNTPITRTVRTTDKNADVGPSSTPQQPKPSPMDSIPLQQKKQMAGNPNFVDAQGKPLMTYQQLPNGAHAFTYRGVTVVYDAQNRRMQ